MVRQRVPRTPRSTAAGSSAERGRADGTSQEAPLDGDSESYPDYVIKEEHGRGGLGRVLRAHDRWLGRPVALKELLKRHPEATARFFREARLTARLQHPGIVPIYELGLRPDGAPYYTMKLIAGERFDKRITRATTLDERLALLPNLIAVADAIAYAHDHAIIHRDLKPSNVIVGEFGETIVIDWGLAKDLAEGRSVGADAAEHSLPQGALESKGRELEDTLLALGEPGSRERTREGHAIGTLPYMPPEQFRGEAVDERADVFALGAFLFHTITGAAPYAKGRTEEVLERIAEARVEPIEKLAPGVPPDLAAIVHKAMARVPSDRYPTAKEFAADLRRFQTGQLVSAHVYSRATLARRFFARHRRAATVSAVFLTALSALGVVSVRRIVAERDRAETERAHAQAEGTRAEQRAQELTFVQARTSLERDPTAGLAWLKTARLDAESYARAAVIAVDARERGVARHVWRIRGNVKEARFTPDSTRVVAAGTLGEILLWDVAKGTVVQRIGIRDRIPEFTITPDAHVVAALGGGDLAIVDVHTGAIRNVPRPHRSMNFTLSHDGRTVAAGDRDGTVRLFDVASGAERVLARFRTDVRDLAFAPDDTWLAAAANDAFVRIIDLRTGRERRFSGTLPDGRFDVYLHVSPDGRRIVSQGGAPVLRLWDVATGTSRVLFDGQGEIRRCVFIDSATFVATFADGAVRVFDLARGSVRSLVGHSACVNQVSRSPNGTALVTCSDDTTVRLWDLRAMTSRVLRGHRATVLTCAFSPDNRSLVSAGTDGTVRVWDTQPSPETVLGGHEADVYELAWSPDGKRLASGDEAWFVRVWDAARGNGIALDGHDAGITGLAFLDADHLASASDDGKVRLWSLASGRSASLVGDGAVVTMTATPDGRTLVTGDLRGKLRVWKVAERAARTLDAHEGAVRALAIAPDGSEVASGGDDGIARTWDLATATPRTVLRGHRDRVTGITYVHGGKQLATSSWDGTVRTWDAATGAPLRVLSGSGDRFWSVAASTHGLRLVAPNHDQTARLWDLASGAEFVLAHDDSVHTAAFSPNDRYVVTGGDDGAARLWDAASGRLLSERRSANSVMTARFPQDGAFVATAGWDDAVRIWPVDERSFVPADAAGLRQWLDAETSVVVTEQGGLTSPDGDSRR